MKKILKFTILLLIILTLVGCSSSDEDKAKKVAEEFVVNIHTVDDTKITEYKKLDGLIPPDANILGEGVPKGTKTGPNEEYTKITQSLDKNIQHLMTKEGYERILNNRFNLLSTRVCDWNNYNSQVTDFILDENLYEDDKDIDKLSYYYEANIKFNSTGGQDELNDVIKGYIELLEEDGQWKVSLYTITSYPKLSYELELIGITTIGLCAKEDLIDSLFYLY